VERKIKFPSANGPVDATEVGYRDAGENWNEYLLDDGTVIRVKVVVTQVVRMDGQYDAFGKPVYAVLSTTVTQVSSTKDMMRKDE